MSPSPAPSSAPSSRTLWTTLAATTVAAALLLVTVVLPAEYGIDPTGIGKRLGLDGLREGPTRTLRFTDSVGGNERYREVAIPDFGKPVPLPNPAVFQGHATAPRTDTLTITLGLDEETEIKTVLEGGQVIVFDWQVEDGDVYTDFHGHDPQAGKDYWVRYEELQDGGKRGSGSLVAPFAGEHGWYWLNVSDHPIVIQLRVTGYHSRIIDYGKKAQ